MEYKQLGTSPLYISRTGFGCMSLPENQATVNSLIDKAVSYGINFFDTADLYQQGINEEMLGKAVAKKRNDLVLATKAGNQLRADGSGWDWNPSKKYILAAAEQSLRRLQTDYIDLLQLHGGTISDPIDETIEAFELLQQQGKIRCYGLSSIRPNVIRAYVHRSRIVSVMMQYSLLDRRPEEECLSLLQQHSIGVLVRGPVAKGLLAGKPAAPYTGYTAEEVQRMITALHEIKEGSSTVGQTAMGYVLQHPVVTSAVAGFRTIAQLEELAVAHAITADAAERLAAVLPAHKYTEHRE